MINQIKFISLLSLFIFIFQNIGYSQDSTKSELKDKWFLWYYPAYNTRINGIAIGFFNFTNDKNQEVNGIKVELMGMGFIGPLIPYFADQITGQNQLDSTRIKNAFKIRGLNISLTGTVEGSRMEGISIGGISTMHTQLRGISLAVFHANNIIDMKGIQLAPINSSYKMRGVQLGLVFSAANDFKGIQIGSITSSTTMVGLQIGLLNFSKDTHGIQFGVININEKRILPIINW